MIRRLPRLSSVYLPSFLSRRLATTMRQLNQTRISFARDERGSTAWIGLILMTVLTAMGVIVGLSTYRDHVVQQFGDAAVALRSLRQSYTYEIEIDGNRDGDFVDPEDCVLVGSFADVVDLVDLPGEAPACMQFNTPPADEI